ncbi:MAG: alpha/beta hydrolase [Bacteroidales bacterium]|nr:alpha/beta hydrolase [Bacteroidales bacterium]
MQTNKKVIQSINLSFCENESKSPSILFLHGNSLSSETFRFQFEDEKLNNYHLLALDFPGHGKSGWSGNKERDYNVFGFRDAVVEFIQELNIKDFIFAGHSLGGHVAIECLPKLSNCRGIMIWGTPPVSRPLDTSQLFMPNPDVGLFFKKDLSDEELSIIGEIVLNYENRDFIKEIVKLSDPQFRSCLTQSLADGKISDEVNILKSSEIPVAILNGDDDPIANKDYMVNLDLPGIWKNKVILFENGGHSMQMLTDKHGNAIEFNKTLLEFANSIF